MKQKTWVTIDLEYDFETDQTRSVHEVVPRLLDLFDKLDIRATFFVLGEIAEKYPKLIKKIGKKHDIGSHGYTHTRLDKLSDDELWFQVSKSKKVIEKLGVKCKGFRAPYFITHPKLFYMLEKAGYEYDSSLQCSYFPGRYNNLLLKEKKFEIKGNKCNGKKEKKLIEYPVPNWTMFKFPPAGFSNYRLFYPISKLFRMPYMIYLHPCEFLDNSQSGVKSFFVKMVYKRNKGDKAWSLFKDLVRKIK